MIIGLTKFVDLTMIRIGSKCFFAYLGIFLNASLVFVTFTNKSLYGSKFYLSVSKLAPVPLKTCFWLNLLPLFATNCTTGLILFVGLDRLIGIAVPLLHSRIKYAYYIIFAAGVCSTYSGYIVMFTYTSIFPKNSNITKKCQLSDVYTDDAKDATVLYNIILNCSTIVCYITVWVLIKRKKIDVTNRFFKSLSLIMLSVIFGWLFYSFARLFIEFFELTTPYSWYVSYVTVVVMSIADASHAIILYKFR
uniref:G-protein coupled receptors family 1 profile domain-containing protein n=1 Tax=Ditylenchus dipsaci TaxID=166011 RepID=A0A915CWH3_9BILA